MYNTKANREESIFFCYEQIQFSNILISTFMENYVTLHTMNVAVDKRNFLCEWNCCAVKHPYYANYNV